MRERILTWPRSTPGSRTLLESNPSSIRPSPSAPTTTWCKRQSAAGTAAPETCPAHANISPRRPPLPAGKTIAERSRRRSSTWRMWRWHKVMRRPPSRAWSVCSSSFPARSRPCCWRRVSPCTPLTRSRPRLRWRRCSAKTPRARSAICCSGRSRRNRVTWNRRSRICPQPLHPARTIRASASCWRRSSCARARRTTYSGSSERHPRRRTASCSPWEAAPA